MKKLFLLLLCVVVITEPSGQRERSGSLGRDDIPIEGAREGRSRSSSLTGHRRDRSSSLTRGSRASGQGEDGRDVFAFPNQGGSSAFGSGFLSSGEDDDEGWMNGVDPETLFAIVGENGGSASVKKTGDRGGSSSASVGSVPAQQSLFDFQAGGDVLFAQDPGNMFGGFDLGSDAFQFSAPADDRDVAAAAASRRDQIGGAPRVKRSQKRGKASGLVSGGPEDADVMEALTRQLEETRIKSVEDDSEELQLLDQAVGVVRRRPQSSEVTADLRALNSLRPKCVRVLKRMEQLFFAQDEAGVTDAQVDEIEAEIARHEDFLEVVEKQAQALLEKYRPKKSRRRKKKGSRAKASQGSGSERGRSSASGAAAF